MSVASFLLLLGFVAACAAALWAMVRLAGARSAPNRERIERTRVPGNFVPLTPDDIAEDDHRQDLRASGKGGL